MNPADPFGLGSNNEQFHKREYHNFKRLTVFNPDIPSFTKPSDPTLAKWWCEFCDSVVVYSAKYTDNDVNRRVKEVNKLACMQPVVSYK